MRCDFTILNGIDIVDNNRFTKLIRKNNNSLKNFFSEKEISYCLSKKNPEESFGSRFAAKEAIIKAINSHILEFDLTKIEVLNEDSGKPLVFINCEILKDKIKNALNKENFVVNLTLSHEKRYSIAHVLIY